jgi:hypothetical protein
MENEKNPKVVLRGVATLNQASGRLLAMADRCAYERAPSKAFFANFRVNLHRTGTCE